MGTQPLIADQTSRHTPRQLLTRPPQDSRFRDGRKQRGGYARPAPKPPACDTSPVSSVAYAIEAALRALHGDLALLLPTMSLVVGLVVVVTANYWQLVRRFPKGGGAAAAAGRAFGPRWTFIPIGALVVDFVLTIGISISAAASAVIALFPSLAAWRIPLALLLLLVVAGLTWFGHGGRLLFAVMTVLFVLVSVAVLVQGFTDPHGGGSAPASSDPGRSAALAVVLAFPVAMALATGVEAPSTAIATLGQLDDSHRRRFGRGTLALLLVIVGGLTLGLTALAVDLHIGIPGQDSTQIADIAQAATGSGWLYGAFQLTSSLLLLAAASSSFQAGPGLLKALAGTTDRPGVLPPFLGRVNRHHTPYWSVVVYLAAAAVIIVAAAGEEQELVPWEISLAATPSQQLTDLLTAPAVLMPDTIESLTLRATREQIPHVLSGPTSCLKPFAKGDVNGDGHGMTTIRMQRFWTHNGVPCIDEAVMRKWFASQVTRAAREAPSNPIPRLRALRSLALELGDVQLAAVLTAAMRRARLGEQVDRQTIECLSLLPVWGVAPVAYAPV
ncbi:MULTISPECIES: amino acid permease [unclassified Streptomyces]|uniref:amino acid permease n=1 Tax=unclassified Streptomyces TaxID=2593676 RepID=UPI001F2B87B7|nr:MULTISPECIES: amino acid permease [unclassified Streptomyces]